MGGRHLMQQREGRYLLLMKAEAECYAISHVKCTQQQPGGQNSCWCSGMSCQGVVNRCYTLTGSFSERWSPLFSIPLLFPISSSQPLMTQADKILPENVNCLFEEKKKNLKECLILHSAIVSAGTVIAIYFSGWCMCLEWFFFHITSRTSLTLKLLVIPFRPIKLPQMKACLT